MNEAERIAAYHDWRVDRCPQCDTPAISTCNCQVRERVCAYGHSWTRMKNGDFGYIHLPPKEVQVEFYRTSDFGLLGQHFLGDQVSDGHVGC